MHGRKQVTSVAERTLKTIQRMNNGHTVTIHVSLLRVIIYYVLFIYYLSYVIA